MLTSGLLSLFGGAFTRLFGGVFEYFTTKQNNQHELDMIDKQIALATVQHSQKMEEISAQGEADVDVEWAKALDTALQPVKTGVPFIDGLNAAIRPIMAIWWCLVMYTVYKGFIIYAAATANTPASQMATIIVSSFDLDIVGSIIGFWYVDRHLRKSTGT